MLNEGSRALILMYLEGFEEFKDEEEVPYGVTPKGITKAVGIDESEPYTYLKKMRDEGLIKKDTRIITSEKRERNVYFITEKGKKREKELWEDLKDNQVTLKIDGEEKVLKVENLGNHIEGRNPIVKAFRAMNENEVIDLTGLDKELEVFVGRKKELNTLRKNLKDVKKNGVKTLFVEGEAGGGKTSLVSKLKPFAHELGFKFVTGTCQSETSDPYLPFKEAFSDYIERDTEEQEKTSMAFIGQTSDETVQDKNLFDAKKEETFYETTNYIKQLAKDDPIVVFLDDLQWVDKATLDILAYMDGKLGAVPVFFIGAYRPEDVSENHHLVEMMHRLRRENRLEKIELEPLSYEDTKETIKGVLGKEEVPQYFVKRLHEKTEGNPLFIKESLRHMVEEGKIDLENDRFPDRSDEVSFSELVYNVIERRVNRLDDDTIKITEMGSVIGKEIPFDLLRETSNIDEIDMLDHIDMLIGNQLWDEDPTEEKFYFSHELIQETVYESIKKLKRKLLHKRVANNIEELYQNDIERWYSDLAKHHRGAENYSQALEYNLKAGKKAEEVYAHEDAIEMYQKSLTLIGKVEDPENTKVEIWEKMSDAYKLLGEYEKCRDYLDKICDEEGSSVDALRAYRKKSRAWLEQGHWKKASDSVETALELEVEEESAKKEIIHLMSTKGWVKLRAAEHEESLKIFQEEKELCEELDDDKLLAKSLHDLGTIHYEIEKFDKSRSFFEEAIEIREELDDIQELISSINNLGLVYMYRGKWDEAKDQFERGLEKCEEIGDTQGICIALNNLGDVYREKGKFQKALDHFNRGMEKAERISNELGLAGFLTNIGITYQKMGRLNEAMNRYEDALEKYKELESKHRIAWTLGFIGDIYAKREKLEEALETYEKSKDLFEEIGQEEEVLAILMDILDIYIEQGKMDKAEDIALNTLEQVENWSSPIMEANCKHVLGKFYREKDELDKAEENLKQSKEIFKDRSPTDLPPVLYDLGLVHLKKGGDDEKAEKILKKASDLSNEMGMELWKNRIQEKLEEVID